MAAPTSGNEARAAGTPALRGWMLWLAAAFLGVLLAAPLLAVQIPPVLDYPNHLARDWLLAHLGDDPLLARMYAPHWAIIPNLAIDAMLPGLIGMLPLFLAGRLMLLVALLAPLGGVLLYQRTLFGARSAWPLTAALVAFNGAFMVGLLDFLFGVAVAFVVAAAWIRWRERHPVATVAGTAAGMVVVFFCHLTALFLLGALIAGYEAEHLPPRGWRGALARAPALIGSIAPVFVLFVFSSTGRAAGPPGWMVPRKLFFTIAPFINYDMAVDVATGLGFVLFVLVALRRGWLILPRSTAIAGLILLALFLISPFRLKGGAFFDLRFAIMLGYLAFAGLRESPALAGRALAIGAAGLAGVFCIRMAIVGFAWSEQGAQVEAMRQVIAPIASGSRVLVANVDPSDAPGWWQRGPLVRMLDGNIMTDHNLPCLVLIERRALVQTLFTDPLQQPIEVLAAYRDSASLIASWGLPSYTLLAGPRSSEDDRRYPYLADWPSHYDYVLVMNAGGMAQGGRFLPDRLGLVGQNDLAALFRVRRPEGP